MMFNPKKTAFARHETFHLRYGWLTKGFQSLSKDKKAFEADTATVTLGVGKNMVSSIKYWLRACQMIESNNYEFTDIGKLILDEKKGLDPYLEDEGTIWLLHWLLVTNPTMATSFYWFFNRFHKPEFTAQELLTALNDFVKETIIDTKRPSLGTIKNDALIIPRMYTQSKGNTRTTLEEALDSPFSLLHLVSQTAGGRSYQSKPEVRPALSIGIIGFAAAQLLQHRDKNIIPIEDLMYSRDNFPTLGSTFRLTETDLITKLERLVNYIPGVFEIRDTAGLHQLFRVNDIDPITYLKTHYENDFNEKAA